MSCACAGSSETPPGSLSGVNALVGVSSFGGNVRVPSRPCGPPTCPQPPVSEAPVSSPYCPTWAKQLTPEETGKLIVVLDDCLHVLKSRCSGMLQFSADTERVAVIDPPFVSSIPQEKDFGYLAKVVPTLHKVCVDGSNECVDEVRQELAAQRLLQASCGSLVVANPPLCGDVPPNEAADLQNQVRFDFLSPVLHENAGCPKEVRFLVGFPGKRGSSQAQVDCMQWALMRGLKLRGSDWNFIPAGNPLEAKAKQVVVVQTEGGDENDPCFELRVLEKGNSGMPSEAEECAIIQRRKVGTDSEGWYAVQPGFRRYYLSSPMTLTAPTTGAGGVTTGLTDYQEYKAMGCKLRALISVHQTVNLSGSGAGGAASITANGELVASNYVPTAGSIILLAYHVSIPLTEDKITLLRINSFAGSASIAGNNSKLVGYEVG